MQISFGEISGFIREFGVECSGLTLFGHSEPNNLIFKCPSEL